MKENVSRQLSAMDHGGVAGVDTWKGGGMEGWINIGVDGVDTWGGGPWRDGLT